MYIKVAQYNMDIGGEKMHLSNFNVVLAQYTKVRVWHLLVFLEKDIHCNEIQFIRSKQIFFLLK